MPPRNPTRRRIAAAAITLVFVLVAVASSAATRDRQPPRIVSAVVEDSNGDARADRLRLTYSEPIRHRKDTDGHYPFAVTRPADRLRRRGQREGARAHAARGRRHDRDGLPCATSARSRSPSRTAPATRLRCRRSRRSRSTSRRRRLRRLLRRRRA